MPLLKALFTIERRQFSNWADENEILGNSSYYLHTMLSCYVERFFFKRIKMALTGFFADVFYVNCHKDMSRHSLKMICLLLPKKVGRYLKKNWGIAFISVCTKQNIQVLNFSMVGNQISLQNYILLWCILFVLWSNFLYIDVFKVRKNI